jgi:hypothetical protein
MTGEMFLAYVKQCLFPTLRPNDIVVTDNCQVHLVAGIRETIEKARAILQPPVRICAGGAVSDDRPYREHRAPVRRQISLKR